MASGQAVGASKMRGIVSMKTATGIAILFEMLRKSGSDASKSD